ncbi:MAG TPA: hypothetical protein VK194_07565, partial [Candidatus Deferrimicrobium sp.]|nr:hypothetical protein [Candidatus Deferrimicrobium sp.]
LVAPLFDADPAARRRNLLLAVALLAALALLGAAAVGALVEQRRTKLSLDPPPDLAGFVEDAYRSLADLPAFEMAALESGDRHNIHSNGDGTIRDERVAVGVTRIVSRERVIQMANGDPSGARTWIEYGRSDVVPGLEVGRYMGLSPECEARWTYVGLEYLLGRPAHRIGCDLRHFWIDVETGIALRAETIEPRPSPGADPTASPSADTDATPAPSAAGGGVTWEVLVLRLGPQPPELFAFVPPDGYTVLRADDPACAGAWFASCVDPVPSPRPARPYTTPPPVTSDGPPAPDPSALASQVHATYAHLPPLAMRIESDNHIAGDPLFKGSANASLHWSDGTGRFRTELLSDQPPTVYIATGPHIWISYPDQGGAVRWLDNRGPYADHGGVGDLMLGFPDACGAGWRHAGVDLVRDRVTHHLVCGGDEFWIDAERLLVVRSESHPTDPLELTSSITEVAELELGPQPADLFELPPGAVVGQPG